MKKMLYVALLVVGASSTLYCQQYIQQYKPVILRDLDKVKQAIKTLNGVNQSAIQKNFYKAVNDAVISLNTAFNSGVPNRSTTQLDQLQADFGNLYQTDPAAVSKTTFDFKQATAQAQNELAQLYMIISLNKSLQDLEKNIQKIPAIAQIRSVKQGILDHFDLVKKSVGAALDSIIAAAANETNDKAKYQNNASLAVAIAQLDLATLKNAIEQQKAWDVNSISRISGAYDEYFFENKIDALSTQLGSLLL